MFKVIVYTSTIYLFWLIVYTSTIYLKSLFTHQPFIYSDFIHAPIKFQKLQADGQRLVIISTNLVE
jgi:hypothetical protein